MGLKYSDGPAVDAATLNAALVLADTEICICEADTVEEATTHPKTECDARGNDGLGTLAEQRQRQRQGHVDNTATATTGGDTARRTLHKSWTPARLHKPRTTGTALTKEVVLCTPPVWIVRRPHLPQQ
jgi:hypothetical protein